MQSIPKKWLTRWILFIATLFITSAFALGGVKHWSGFLIPGVVFIFFLRHLGQLKLSHAAIMGGATAFLLLIPSFFIPDIWVGEPQHHVQYLVGIGSVSALMVAIFFSPLWWIFSLYVGPQFHFYPPFALWIIIAVVNWAIYGALASFISKRLRRKKKSVSIAKHRRKAPLRKSGKIETTIALTLIMMLLSGYGTIVFGHLNTELVEAVNLPEVEEYVAGDLHAHSDYSGYDRTIADMAERAQLIGYRFLMMTEYNWMIQSQVGVHDSETWQSLKGDCAAQTIDTFLCLPGLEISCDEGDTGGVDPMHYLAHDLNLAVGSEGTWFPRKPDFIDYWYNDETVFDWVSDPEDNGFGNKGWGRIAHPHHFGTGSDFRVYGGQGFVGMEVWNGGGAGLGADYWDEALTEDWRHRGYAGTDSDGDLEQLDECWNWVYSPSLTEANLHRYLQEGRSCFSNGPFVAFEVRSGGTWYPMGSNYVGPNPNRLYVVWQSWPEFGVVTSIKLKRFSNFSGGGYQTVVTSTLINPDNYGGEAIFSLSLPSGVNVLRVWAETSEGKLGFANPIWVNPEQADFGLTTLYEVHLDLDLYLNKGSMLAVKFYNYLNAYEGEEIIWSGAAPTRVTLLGDIPHPMGYGVKKVTLVATDSAGNVISTIVSFRVTKGDLWDRIIAILGYWPEATDEERDQLFAEIIGILGQWPEAP